MDRHDQVGERDGESVLREGEAHGVHGHRAADARHRREAESRSPGRRWTAHDAGWLPDLDGRTEATPEGTVARRSPGALSRLRCGLSSFTMMSSGTEKHRSLTLPFPPPFFESWLSSLSLVLRWSPFGFRTPTL